MKIIIVNFYFSNSPLKFFLVFAPESNVLKAKLVYIGVYQGLKTISKPILNPGEKLVLNRKNLKSIF